MELSFREIYELRCSVIGGLNPTTTMAKIKVVRDTRSGQFVPAREATRRPSTTVTETIKK